MASQRLKPPAFTIFVIDFLQQTGLKLDDLRFFSDTEISRIRSGKDYSEAKSAEIEKAMIQKMIGHLGERVNIEVLETNLDFLRKMYKTMFDGAAGQEVSDYLNRMPFQVRTFLLERIIIFPWFVGTFGNCLSTDLAFSLAPLVNKLYPEGSDRYHPGIHVTFSDTPLPEIVDTPLSRLYELMLEVENRFDRGKGNQTKSALEGVNRKNYTRWRKLGRADGNSLELLEAATLKLKKSAGLSDKEVANLIRAVRICIWMQNTLAFLTRFSKPFESTAPENKGLRHFVKYFWLYDFNRHLKNANILSMAKEQFDYSALKSETMPLVLGFVLFNLYANFNPVAANAMIPGMAAHLQKHILEHKVFDEWAANPAIAEKLPDYFKNQFDVAAAFNPNRSIGLCF
jgi:hypothetical protein